MITAVIQARLGSTRLPGKIFRKIEGKTVFEHVLERIKKSRLVQNIVVATTLQKRDLEIAGFCAQKDIAVYRGDERDVLDRFYQAARLFKAKHIVRVTPDCPLIDPKIIDKVVRLYFEERADYASNTLKISYPDGEDVEVFSFAALKKTWRKANLLSEREHVTPFIRKHPELFKLANLKYKKDLSDKRWTLDTANDFHFIKSVYRGLYKNDAFFSMEKIIEFIEKYPQIEKINRQITRNEGYLKSLREDAVVKKDR